MPTAHCQTCGWTTPDDWGEGDTEPDDTTDASVDHSGQESAEAAGTGAGELSDNEPSGIEASGDDAPNTQIPDESTRDATDDPTAGRESLRDGERDDRHDSNPDPEGHADTGTDQDGQPDRPRFYVVDRPDVPEHRTGGYGDAFTDRDGTLVRPPLFDGPPKRTDAVQGDLGDCGVIAVIGAVAQHRPDAIKELIAARDDGSVEVRLHEARSTLDTAEPTGNLVPLVITPQVPLKPDFPIGAFADTYSSGVAWPSMVEKALAGVDVTWPDRIDQRGSGYARLDHGSTPQQQAEIMTQLTGRPADVHALDTRPRAESRTEQTLRALLDAACPVIVGTKRAGPFGDPPHGLYQLHAYEVTDVSDGIVMLHNPWGRDHPDPMSVSDLLDNIQRWCAALRPEGEPHDRR